MYEVRVEGSLIEQTPQGNWKRPAVLATICRKERNLRFGGAVLDETVSKMLAAHPAMNTLTITVTWENAAAQQQGAGGKTDGE